MKMLGTPLILTLVYLCACTVTPEPSPSTATLPMTLTQIPTSSTTPTYLPTDTSTPIPTDTPEPTIAPPLGSEADAGVDLAMLLPSPEEIDMVLPLGPLGCIANAFGPDCDGNACTGSMCMLLGAKDPGMLMPIIEDAGDPQGCAALIAELQADPPGASVKLPSDSALPPDTQVYAKGSQAYALAGCLNRYKIHILLTTDPQTIKRQEAIKALDSLGTTMMNKIEQPQAAGLDDQLMIPENEVWKIHAAGYGFTRLPLYTVRSGEFDADLFGIGDMHAYMHGEPDQGISLVAAFENVNEQYAGQIQGFKAEQPAETTLNQAQGLQASFTATNHGEKLTGTLLVLNHQPGWGMTAICMGPSDTWENAGQAACDQILGSLVFFTPSSEDCVVSTDQTYGLTEENPVRVGGNAMNGPSREEAYLAALRGPQGQELAFERAGSIQSGDTILDAYEIQYDGLQEPVTLYLDEYSYGELLAPPGFTCAYQFPIAAP